MIENSDFDCLNTMRCKTEVYLQILTPTQPIRLKSRLIGVDPFMSVILAMHNDDDWLTAKNFIREGQVVIIRLLNSEESEANIFAFRCNIQKIMSIAGNWLVMDYPKQIEKVCLRQNVRYPIRHDCTIYHEKSTKPVSTGYLNDISIKGCAFTGDFIAGCVVGDSYQLCIQLSENKYNLDTESKNENEKFNIQVTVKNITDISIHTEQKQYGFVFTQKDQTTIDFIKKTIFYNLSH
ncbi:PilZ domain-containing protein [Psychromonas aquimarina]|uniref:PilZ domain-containing protein n=1 Tax=Psychromonas aquimarina TaxID=444919 RepID=UPI00040CF5A2|nr:PilZ domain-containing protein [Psychromonas aquimarina]